MLCNWSKDKSEKHCVYDDKYKQTDRREQPLIMMTWQGPTRQGWRQWRGSPGGRGADRQCWRLRSASKRPVHRQGWGGSCYDCHHGHCCCCDCSPLLLSWLAGWGGGSQGESILVRVIPGGGWWQPQAATGFSLWARSTTTLMKGCSHPPNQGCCRCLYNTCAPLTFDSSWWFLFCESYLPEAAKMMTWWSK